LGRFGSTEQPAGVEEMHRLDQADERALDPCAALQLRLTIDPQGDVACAFLLADANDPGEAAALLDALAAPEDWDAALTDVRTFWLRTVERLQIQTPIPEIDRMVNGWLPYQN